MKVAYYFALAVTAVSADVTRITPCYSIVKYTILFTVSIIQVRASVWSIGHSDFHTFNVLRCMTSWHIT